MKRLLSSILVLLFCIALGQQLYKLYFVSIQGNFVDFNVYTRAISIAMSHGDVYTFPSSDIHAIPFNYPPTSLVFFLPLISLPTNISSVIFLFSSLLSLLLSIWFICVLLFPKRKRVQAFFISSIFFIQYFPTKFTLTLGQINLLILLLITSSYYTWVKRRDMISGVFLGIASLIKIFPVFLIPFFIKAKQWKTVISFVTTLLCGFLITVLLFSPSLVFSFFGSVSTNLFFHAGNISYFDQSLNAFLLRIGFPSLLRLTFRYIFTAISLLAFLTSKDRILSYFGLIFSILIFLPSFAWFHHYVIIIPVYMILWTETPGAAEKIVLVFSYLLTSFHFRTPDVFPGPNIFLSSLPFFGGFFLWLLAMKRCLVKKPAQI